MSLVCFWCILTYTQPITLGIDHKHLCEHLRLLREQTLASLRDRDIALGRRQLELQQLFQLVQDSGQRIQQENADRRQGLQGNVIKRPYDSTLGVYNFPSFTREIMRRFQIVGSFAIYLFFF